MCLCVVELALYTNDLAIINRISGGEFGIGNLSNLTFEFLTEFFRRFGGDYLLLWCSIWDFSFH